MQVFRFTPLYPTCNAYKYRARNVGNTPAVFCVALTPTLHHTVCNRCAYDLRTVAMQMSNTADKTEGLLFVDAGSVLNQEAAIRNIHAKPVT